MCLFLGLFWEVAFTSADPSLALLCQYVLLELDSDGGRDVSVAAPLRNSQEERARGVGPVPSQDRVRC